MWIRETGNVTLECTSCLQSSCDLEPGVWKGQAQACSKQRATQRPRLGSAMVKSVVNGKALGNSASVFRSPEQTPDDITSCLSSTAKTSRGFNCFNKENKAHSEGIKFIEASKDKGCMLKRWRLSNEAGCPTAAAACASVCAHAPFRRELDIRNVASAIF